MATRVTLTLIATVMALLGAHMLAPLPTAAYGIAMTAAMQGALQIKDPTDRKRLMTRMLGGAAGFFSVAVAVALSPSPFAVHAAFICLVFLAVYVRKYGVRWNAVGMFAFMCYFIGAYLHPAPADLPGVALALLIAGIVAHVVRVAVLPERPAEEFAHAALATFERTAELRGLLRSGLRGGWNAASRREAQGAERRVAESVLIAEACLPTDPVEPASPASVMAVALFDLHLASETAFLTATAAKADGERLPGLAQQVEARLDRLDRAVGEARAQAAQLPKALFDRPLAVESPAATARSGASALADPALRRATQVSCASAIAMTGGLFLSETRWFWAILTAFLVFTNTQSRGDTALRALNRAGGTLLGIVIGIGLATLLHGAFFISSLLIVVFTFVGFYLLQLSYGAMVFFVTIVLSLLYGLLGEFTAGLLVLRLEETLIGVCAGVFVSFVVFPQRTTDATDRATDAFFSALDRILAAAAEARLDLAGTGVGILALARHLDRRQADLAAAARPLGSNWQPVRRPGSVRRRLLAFAAVAYWTRVFARSLSVAAPDAAQRNRLEAAIRDLRAEIDRARAARIRFLEPVRPLTERQDTNPLVSDVRETSDDPLFALDVLARIVRRLVPQDDATSPAEP